MPPVRKGVRVFFRQRFKLLVALFPLALLASELYFVWRCFKTPEPEWFAAACLHLYLTPLIVYRVHNLIVPLREGRSHFGIDYYSPWLTAQRLQLVYAVFPVLERVLTVIPGLFSLWLRAWGSKVGHGVLWLPGIEITDRTHLDIGDDVFFGNKVYLSPHVVRDSGDKKFLLYFKHITIGSGTFLGAGSRLGPGVIVPANSRLPLLTDLYVNAVFAAERAKESA